MTRILPLLLLSTLAISTVGCADDGDWSPGRRSMPGRGTAKTQPEPPTATTASSIKVTGTVDNVEATKVDVMAMDDKGELTPVGSAPVKDGKFETEIPEGTSPTGVYILKAKNVVDSIVNSGFINGIPAFAKGFLVDVPMDAVTAYKAEILQTIAKKGVPGAQNYINVLNAFVDAHLAGDIAVDSVLTNDVIEVVGATADAVIAAEEVIEQTLRKAGLPVDFDKLQAAQASTASGIQGFLLDASNKRISTAKNLVAGFQSTLADIAKPIDDAIFNAVVNGGGAFGSTVKEKAPEKGFAASKSAFTLTSALSSSKMNEAFQGTSLEAKVKDAANAFTAAVGKAQSGGELEAAKQSFMTAVVGEEAKSTFAPLEAIVQKLKAALESFNPDEVASRLGELDLTAFELPASLQQNVGADRVETVTNALRLVQKQVAQ